MIIIIFINKVTRIYQIKFDVFLQWLMGLIIYFYNNKKQTIKKFYHEIYDLLYVIIVHKFQRCLLIDSDKFVLWIKTKSSI